ncbi:unnamed protein product [Triticum aestivum]|uniref:Uncharacterized protein n=1 Tax=Triticum aestivum TaxID=4565 RepID=A0A7H4LAV7_WHEAT|nr:unnamed protein product [Triticum aestivum]
MVDELELPSFGQKEKERKLAGGVGAAATRKVKKVSHKTVKACVMSPKGREDATVQSAATTTTSQQAPTVQRPTDEVASQKATSPAKSKVYQKRAAKKQNTATDHILQATEQKKQATAESAKTENRASAESAKSENRATAESAKTKNRATGATFEATQQKTQATRVSMQAATAQESAAPPTQSTVATTVLEEATPEQEQATTQDSTDKPPVLPNKQAYSAKGKEISLDDVRDINKLLEKCVSPGSTPPLARSNSAGTIPVIRTSVAINLPANKGACDSGEEARLLQRSKSGSAVWDDYCPAPPSDLGIDEPAGITGEEGKAAEDKGVVNAAANGDIEWGIDWGNMDFNEVVEGAVKNAVGQSAGHMSPAGFSMPTEVAKTTAEWESSCKGAASSSEEPVPEKRERRIQKAPPSQRSPYVNVEIRKDFTCNAETNRVPQIINYRGYFCTIKELAQSMRKAGWMKTHVFELGIEAIMYNRHVGSKKIMMPVRFSTWLQWLDLNVRELHDRFRKSNRLDEQDMVMIPVLENLDPENANGAHHYWVLNINLRDKMFEVFDSWRMLKKSKRLDDVARAIVAAVCVLWDKYYPKQAKTMDQFPLVDIDAPKQAVS